MLSPVDLHFILQHFEEVKSEIHLMIYQCQKVCLLIYHSALGNLCNGSGEMGRGAIESKIGVLPDCHSPMPSSEDLLEQNRIRYLMQQEEQFEQEKPKLLRQFLKEFIAFENGHVLDHDSSESELVERVYRQYGYRDLLIKQVLEPEPRLSVGGAFVECQEH
jgi:hypothetical protein